MLNLICQLSSFYMLGAIWLIQLVHYPSFLLVAPERFQAFHTMHTGRMGLLVGPMMILELASSILLLITEDNIWSVSNLLLVVGIWVSTFAVSVPLHNKLVLGFNQEVIQQLIQTNWIRTLLWTMKAAVVTYWLYYKER